MTGHVWRTIQAHAQTWRPYTLCYPALVGAAGACAAGGTGRPDTLALAAGAPALGWLAGHYLGDYFDRHLDAVAKPQRPIPSGRLSPTAALASGTACAAGSALLLVVAGWRTLPLFAAAMAGIVAYSRFCKRRGISGNLVRGFLTTLAFLVGTMAVQPQPQWRALPFALVFLLHDTSSNLVGTIRDVDGDRAGGYRSVPVRRGVVPAVRLAAGLYCGAITVAAPSALLPMEHRGAYGLLLAVAVGIGAASFLPLVRQGPVVTQALALRAHEILVAERLVLTTAVISAWTGLVTALAMLVPVLGFSLLTQHGMRSRYELQPPPKAVREGRGAYQV